MLEASPIAFMCLRVALSRRQGRGHVRAVHGQLATSNVVGLKRNMRRKMPISPCPNSWASCSTSIFSRRSTWSEPIRSIRSCSDVAVAMFEVFPKLWTLRASFQNKSTNGMIGPFQSEPKRRCIVAPSRDDSIRNACSALSPMECASAISVISRGKLETLRLRRRYQTFARL